MHTVWIVTRRPKKVFVAVAGGLGGAEDLAAADAAEIATRDGVPVESITTWSEHGEPPGPGRKFTRASVHVASRVKPEWTLTYDCAVHPIHQRPTPKKSKPTPAPEPALTRALEVLAEVK